MARKRTRKVTLIKEKLITRIQSGYYIPGDRFFSNRGVAQHFGISYQTAHRLLCELRDEGWLRRRPFSGSYISGRTQALSSATLFLNERARRPNSFGAYVSSLLTRRLSRERIRWTVVWGDGDAPAAGSIPILWECRGTLEQLSAARRFCLLINELPPAGVARSFIDSVSVDDFSGGVSAGELLATRFAGSRSVAIMAGPSYDRRNIQRVDGFTSVVTTARIISAESWDYEAGYRIAPDLLAGRPDAVFCCNDRLASALIAYGRDNGDPLPPIVGFDNAPVSESLNLTTIAIPWEQLVERIVGIVKLRLAGDKSGSVQYILNPLPIIRDIRFR